MRIKELEIDNFKSFANKVSIPFLPGFTTISGPNGSGKSNIVDSVLFALGLTTSRALRSDRGVGDLISTHNSRNEVYVKVVFETKEGEDMSFARRVKKSSQGFNSTYYINDKVCTLSQMHFELEKYNITPNSYNVIMQGDVTSITNCSPNERRKILDEIAGVADFDRKIEQATRELETVDTRVGRSNIIMGEIDTRLEQLSSEREIALKYKNLKDEKTSLEGQITTVRYFDSKKSLDIVHENILSAGKEKKKLEVDKKELGEKIELQKVECKRLSDEVRAKGEDQQLEVKKQAEEKKGEIERKKTSTAHCDKLVYDNLKTVEGANNGIESLQQKNEQTTLRIKEKREEVAQLEMQLAGEKQELKDILAQMGGLNKTADEHIEKRNQLRRELDALKDSETELIKEKLPLENQFENLRKEADEANVAVENMEFASKNFTGEKDRLGLLIGTLEKEMEECKTVQRITFDELDKVKNQLSDANYNIQLAHKKIATMEAKKQAFKEFGLGAGVETVLASNIRGVHAPLLQLLDVDAQYADAIDIALGGRSRFVVVDDENVATRAIELLKSSGRSRATFLPLNKLKGAPNKLPLPKDNGVIDYAINLLDFEDKYLDAFYFALGDTLVVEDMHCAKKLMGKYRIVTLDGELFEKSGAITGGAKKREGAAFGKVDDKELQTFLKRLEEFEAQYGGLEKKKTELEARLDKVRADYSNASNEYNSAKMELQNLIKNNGATLENIEKKLARIAEIAPLMKKIEQELDAFEKKHIKLSDEILGKTGAVEDVEKMIDEGELNKLKEMTGEIEGKIRTTETKINAANNEIEKENNNINFQNTIIEQRKADITRLLSDNETLKTDKERFEIEIQGFLKELEVLEAEIVKLGENLVELQQQRDEANGELLNLEKRNDIYDNQLTRVDEQIESYKARRRELEPVLEAAREELVEAGIDPNKIEPVTISIEEITNKIQRLQKRMDDMEPVNMRALTDYDEVLARQNELREKINTLSAEKVEIANRMKGYENLKKETFIKTYKSVNENFKAVFAELSEGEGTLILENESDPFSGGLTFEATQRDKKKQRLAGMSGGEKTLTALAFVFAVQKHLPAPFYAFDEVDMHLDGPNVEKLAKMLNNQAKETQFVVISLRKPMIDSADRMIGVTQKDKGVTKISGIKLKDD